MKRIDPLPFLTAPVTAYSKKWKPPINLSKTLEQVFHSQAKTSAVTVYIEDHKTELVKVFRYLDFIWTSKMSLNLAIDEALESIQRIYIKLKWIKDDRILLKEVLRKCFFAYSFPYFSFTHSSLRLKKNFSKENSEME